MDITVAEHFANMMAGKEEFYFSNKVRLMSVGGVDISFINKLFFIEDSMFYYILLEHHRDLFYNGDIGYR